MEKFGHGSGIEGPEQTEQNKGQQHDNNAAQHPEDAGNELGENELRIAHRQGVHQVAFAAQQIAGEALDDAENGHDGDGHAKRQIHEHQHGNGGGVHQKGGDLEGNAHEDRHGQNGQIQPAVHAAGGLELVF